MSLSSASVLLGKARLLSFSSISSLRISTFPGVWFFPLFKHKLGVLLHRMETSIEHSDFTFIIEATFRSNHLSGSFQRFHNATSSL